MPVLHTTLENALINKKGGRGTDDVDSELRGVRRKGGISYRMIACDER